MTRDARQRVRVSARTQLALRGLRVLSVLIAAVTVATASILLRTSVQSGLNPPNPESPLPTTLEPLSTSPVAEPGVEFEATVTERPGVPTALGSRAWFSASGERWQAGELGSTARVLLPVDEEPLSARGHFVATVVNGPLFADKRTSTLRVRDIRTGAVTREMKSELFIDIAAFAGDYLFFAGTSGNEAQPGEDPIYPGGGLWAWSLVVPDDPVLVVPPEPTVRMSTAPFGEGIRAPLRVSATGHTVASAVYMAEGATGRVDLIDVPTLKVRTTLPRYVYAINDSTALMQASAESGNKVELIDLSSGEARWASTLSDEQSSPVMILQAIADEEMFVLQFERSPRLIVAILESASGTIRELLVQDGADKTVRPLYMEAGLSSASVIVLLERPGVAATVEAAGGWASASILDGATGHLTHAAFDIGAP